MQKRLVVLSRRSSASRSLAVAAQAAPSGQAASGKTIVTVAAGDKRFTTLVALVKQAGLVSTLNGKGPFTVFAPTNAAFTKLKQTAPGHVRGRDDRQGAAQDGADLPRAREARAEHAAIAAAKKNASVKTVQGESIKLSLKGGKLTLNGSSKVIVADVKASNGVVHAIDAVLVPPSAA